MQRTVEATTQVAFTFYATTLILVLLDLTLLVFKEDDDEALSVKFPWLTDEIKQWHRLNHQVVLVLNNQQRREKALNELLKEKISPLFIVKDGLLSLIQLLYYKAY